MCLPVLFTYTCNWISHRGSTANSQQDHGGERTGEPDFGGQRVSSVRNEGAGEKNPRLYCIKETDSPMAAVFSSNSSVRLSRNEHHLGAVPNDCKQ